MARSRRQVDTEEHSDPPSTCMLAKELHCQFWDSTSFGRYPGLPASCCIHQEGVTLSCSSKLLEGSFRPDPIITPSYDFSDVIGG